MFQHLFTADVFLCRINKLNNKNTPVSSVVKTEPEMQDVPCNTAGFNLMIKIRLNESSAGHIT